VALDDFTFGPGAPAPTLSPATLLALFLILATLGFLQLRRKHHRRHSSA
jgi:cytochrome oxidase assembly protein ShyY1